MSKTVKKYSMSGFTLVELAIVMTIIGVLLGGAILAVKPVIQKVQYSSTEKSITTVRHALSAYAVRHNRLPCPASPNPGTEPFGAERGSGANGTDYGTCTGDDVVGIIPFRTLGLSEDAVRDGWDHYITYRVSPAFAINPGDIPKDDQNRIHEKCRTGDWIEYGDGGAGEVYTLGATKEDFNGNPKSFTSEDEEITIYGVNRSEYKTSQDAQGGFAPLYTIDPNTGDKIYDNSVKYMNWWAWTSRGYEGIGVSGGNIWDGRQRGAVVMDFATPVDDIEVEVDDVENNRNSGIDFQITVVDDEGNFQHIMHEVVIGDVEFSDQDEEPAHAMLRIFKAQDGETPENSTELVIPDGFKITRAVMFSADVTGSYGRSSLALVNVNAGTLSSGGGSKQNINPAKARFCCPISSGDYVAGNDLRILDAAGGNTLVQSNRTTTMDHYNHKDEEATGTIDYTSATAVAYALISHGPNGHGSFLANGTNNTYTAPNFGTDEVENVASIDPDDQTVVYREIDQSGDNTYFDDVVVWRTQDQVYSEFSTDSCLKP